MRKATPFLSRSRPRYPIPRPGFYEGKGLRGTGKGGGQRTPYDLRMGVYLRSADGRRAPQQSDRGGGIRHNKNLSRKIDLGIPNYGYDWTLPYIRGESKTDTIGNIEAVQIAIENNAEILFDSTAMSPWFRYIKDGMEHEVWFEDVRSLREKFRLVKAMA